MKLHELHILQRQAGAQDQTASVARTGMRRRAGKVDSAVTARRQDDGLCAETMQRSIHQRPRDNAAALAVYHHEIQHEIFDKEFGSDPQGLPIQRVEQSMPRPIRRCASAGYRMFAEVAHVSTERPLIDFSIFGAGEGHPRMFQFEDGGDGLPAHIFDGILVAEPVGPFDRVVHMPLPIVFAEVAETGCNAALGRNGMTACRKHLCDAGSRQARLDGTLRGTQTGTAGTDDDDIKRMVDELVCVCARRIHVVPRLAGIGWRSSKRRRRWHATEPKEIAQRYRDYFVPWLLEMKESAS